MKTSLRKLGFLVAVSILTVVFSALTVIAQASANVYAVTSTNQLVRFNTSTPGTLTTIGPISGMQAGENVVGIDFRPLTGQLYAVGSNSRLYVINKGNASATFIATISTTLTGTNFGVDFNPIVDRIRIVSNMGQNLRVNPSNGVAIIDTPINGPTSNVDAAAYTNSFSGSTTTTLYDISAATDSLYTQNPPNSGVLNTVGALGVNLTEVNGFDILSSDNTAYAVLTVGGTTGIYTISLTTGAATLIGAIGVGVPTYSGFAIESGMVANYIVYGVTTSNNLVRFHSVRPNTILGSTPITGLQAGETVLGIDFRPATGELYALGSTSRLYRVNTFTAAATQVGSAGSFTLNGTSFGFDFNPVPDRIRVTSDTDQNLRLNPNDGALAAADVTLAFAAGDPNAAQNPNVVASSYTNSFAGSVATTLYDIDSNLDILVTQNPPNNGTLNTVGRLGVNVTNEIGFDIATGSNIAFASIQVAAGPSQLYSVNLTTGAAAPIGPIGGLLIRDIAVGRSTAGGSSTATLDFDGDGRTDYSVLRPSQNTWYIHRSSNGSYFSLPFGLNASDTLTPGDFDGDGRSDIAVWRNSSGDFYVLRSSDNLVTIFHWGTLGDEPVARDYDGDGKTDFAIVRRTGGLLVWYIISSLNDSVRIEQFGLASDKAVPADYDGDGRYDLAVYRGDQGMPADFYVQASTAGTGFTVNRWGLGGDVVVPGDYDGDGKADFAVVRPVPVATWWVLRSSDGSSFAESFGAAMFTTPGDYDGDGRTDFSWWNPTNGVFSVFRTAAPGLSSSFQFGTTGDYPLANIATQ